MVESAYVKLCLGDTEDALFMFTEVRDVATTNKDDFLSQVCSRFIQVLSCKKQENVADIKSPSPSRVYRLTTHESKFTPKVCNSVPCIDPRYRPTSECIPYTTNLPAASTSHRQFFISSPTRTCMLEVFYPHERHSGQAVGTGVSSLLPPPRWYLPSTLIV